MSLPILASLDRLNLESMTPPLAGFIVVMIALASLWILLEVQGYIFKTIACNCKKESSGVSGRADYSEDSAVAKSGEALPAERIALITAAVHVTQGETAKIVSIKPTR